jgi:hypothetical protein
MHPKNVAIGVDNDPEVLKFGLEHFGSVYSGLENEEQTRVTVLQQDVGTPGCNDGTSRLNLGLFDIVCAQNFSYSVFKKRSKLLHYFRSVLSSLNHGGLFFIDLHGGRSVCQSGLKVKHAIVDPEGLLGGAEYEWEQECWDPVSSDYLCHINFVFPDGSDISPAFTYDWRHWSMAEVCDTLTEAGFTDQHIFWPDVDSEGALTGKYSESSTGRDDETWNAYIAAGK